MSDVRLSLFALGCVFGCTPTITQVTLTAYRALKIAQRRLRPEVRSHLLGVFSPRTDDTLIPQAWRFLFHDATTIGNCRTVTVAARASSEHPETVEAFGETEMDPKIFCTPILQNKLVVDSVDILAKARASLPTEEIHSAEFTLAQNKTGGEPQWTLRFFTRLDEPPTTVQVRAKTGEIVDVENGTI